MTQSSESHIEEAEALIERFAEIAEDDLDLVAEAVSKNSIAVGQSVSVDIDAVERHIRRAIDARCFDDLGSAVGLKRRKTHHRGEA